MPRRALVALAIGLGIFLRFHNLEDMLVWHDEIATRIFAAGYTTEEWQQEIYTGQVLGVADVVKYQHHDPGKSVVDAIVGMARNDPQHPPVYYILARVWVSCFGHDVATLRSLSALLSLLAFPAMFWLCREALGSTRAAWAGVALVAVSPFFVLYAQEAREYSLWTVLILFSCAALLRAIRLSEGGGASFRQLLTAWASYGLFIVLGLYTSSTTASVIIAHVLTVVIRDRARFLRSSWMCAGTLAIGALFFLPWAMNLLEHFEAFQVSMSWAKVIVIPRGALLRIMAFNTSRTVVDLWHELETPVAWAAMFGAVALVAWAIAWLIRRAPRDGRLLVLVLMLVPIGMLLVPDLLFGGIRSVSTRYMTPVWIGVEVALAGLLCARGRWLAVVLALGVASGAWSARQEAVWTKGISRGIPEVARQINQSAAPLVVGNMEQHNPGNLLALANLLGPGSRMQFLRAEMEGGYVLPPQSGDVYLFSPIDEFRRGLEAREHVRTRLLYKDLHLTLWKVER